MAKAIGAHVQSGSSHRGTAAVLAAWLEEHQDLLRGLLAIRALEPEAHEAVQAVLNVQKIRVVRLSWELWASFTRADAADPDALLLDHVPEEMVRLGKDALFGKGARPAVPYCGRSGSPRSPTSTTASVNTGAIAFSTWNCCSLPTLRR